MQDDTVNGMEETVKKPAVFEKKVPQVLINSKDTVSVLDVNELCKERGNLYEKQKMIDGRNIDVKTKIDYYSRFSVCGENDSNTETFYFL